MSAIETTRFATGKQEIYYPESDGKPMAETDLHRDEMFELIYMLQARYADALDVYVSGNLLLYYVEGDPTKSVAPDTFVVFGVAKHRRRTYKLWEEGVPPAVVFEVTSRKTRSEDRRKKKELYAKLGVAEYYLYDPEADYLRPPLQGFQLLAGEYVPLSALQDGTLHSHVLGVDLRLIDGQLEVYDVATGDRLPRLPEHRGAMEKAEARAAAAEAESAAQAARAAVAQQQAQETAAENARLRAELDRLRDEGDGG